MKLFVPLFGLALALPSSWANTGSHSLRGAYDFERQLAIAYDACNDGAFDSGCAESTKCSTTDLPANVVEFWDVKGNVNCLQLGFDFGWKTGDPGCFDETDQAFAPNGANLGATSVRSCPNWDCSLPASATYSVDCKNAEGAQFTDATISANLDMYVIVKAQGLYLYKYEEGTSLDVITPGGKAISHIEFCFLSRVPVQANHQLRVPVHRLPPVQAKHQLRVPVHHLPPVQAKHRLPAQVQPPVPAQAKHQLPAQVPPLVPVRVPAEFSPSSSRVPVQVHHPLPVQAKPNSESSHHLCQSKQHDPSQVQPPVPAQAKHQLPAQVPPQFQSEFQPEFQPEFRRVQPSSAEF
ncbi:expressed unknown protein [Seminavis robusta]|uniref:Uncharacterized protein n=1 Tax=Seminavis robusta TaxID=568900 RepID=A0A9N8EIC6_9STRA|nr:expressed unknown protein [Seminavis robusta]|eukprot:Sro982_g227620.1 n/a (350) ;mRNA; f:8662-9939